MAYILNTTQTATASANNYTVTLGSHSAGDLLLVFLNQDGGGTNITPNTAGWAMLGTGAASGGNRSQWAWKIAASGAETNPNFSGANDDWIGTCLVIRDAHATEPFGATPTSGTDFVRTDWNAVNTTTSGSLTTAVDECLLLYAFSSDSPSALTYMNTTIADTTCVDKYTTSAATHIIGYKQQQTAGAAPTVTMYHVSASEGGNSWVIAVRNKTNGVLSPDIRPTFSVIKRYGNFGLQHDGVTWQAPNNFASSINSITCSSTAPTITTSTTFANGWGTGTGLGSTESTTGSWVGGTHTISSTDMTGKILLLDWRCLFIYDAAISGSEGILVGFSDGTNWVTYQISTAAKRWTTTETFSVAIALGNATPYASSGSIDWSAVTRIGFFNHRIGSSTTSGSTVFRNAYLFGTTAITGGGTSIPVTLNDYVTMINSWDGWKYAELQGSSQILVKTPLQIGDGINKTYFDSTGVSYEYPQAWSNTTNENWQMIWNALSNAVSCSIYAGSSDEISLSAGVIATDVSQPFSINASSSTSATYNFVGAPIVGYTPTWKTGIDCVGPVFVSCGEINGKGANFTNVSIKKTTSTNAAINFDTSGPTITNCEIDVTSTSANYHIDLGTSVTAISLVDVTFTGTPAIDKIHVSKTTGTVTITISGTTILTASDVTSEGATVVINAPAIERGLSFTGLVAGSQVKVFTTGTDTELFSKNNSSTSETWNDATTGSITVDYVIQKAGYDPIRVTGITVTGAVTGGVLDVPISQTVDRSYVASSGLIINTNVFANSSTKKFGLTTTSTVQNFYSYMIEQWIALGDSGEAYANVEFPLKPNGPNSFSFKLGWEWDLATYANSITNLSRDGFRYLNTSGNQTAIWAAILTANVPAGALVRYQQSDGGTTQDAAATGNMDELVQIYGDATHGNFDYRSYLVLKVQEMGYDQAESDAVALYGNLEDQLYVVGLAPTPNSVATGDPSLANPPTITDHAGSPVTWNGKNFSITITDSAAGNTGEDIMKWLRYNFETGGAFQGTDAFNWHDLVQQNGSYFKTVRGKVYGDTGATLKGVRVVQNDGTSSHPDFNLYTADDGTTYTPPTTVVISLSGFVSGTRIQIYDTANSLELFNDIVLGTTKVYTEVYSVDRTIRVRASLKDGVTAKDFVEANLGTVTSSSPTVSRDLEQSDDATYNANAINGSTVTGVTFTDAATDIVNIDISAGSVTWQQIYAAFVAWMYTEAGIADDIAYVDAVDTANYRLTSMKIKNTSSPSVPLEITGGYGVDSTTGASVDIVDTTGGTLVFAPDHVVGIDTESQRQLIRTELRISKYS